MLKRLGLVVLAACSLAATACTDAVAPVSPGGASAWMDEAPPGAPSEFDQPTHLAGYSLDLRLEPTYGRGVATMYYWANRAEQSVSLTLRTPEGGVIAPGPVTSQRSEWYPHEGTLQTVAYVGVNGSCGHMLDGQSQHRAWHEWQGFTWSDQGKGLSKNREQPVCAEIIPGDDGGGSGGGDGSGGGGGSDGGSVTCTTRIYMVETWNGDTWQFSHYEYETTCQ